MNRRRLFPAVAAVAICSFAAVCLCGADKPAKPSENSPFTDKFVTIALKDHTYGVYLENPQVRKIGKREFIVGNNAPVVDSQERWVGERSGYQSMRYWLSTNSRVWKK